MLLLLLTSISKWDCMVAAAQPNCPLLALSVSKEKDQSGAFILWLQQLMQDTDLFDPSSVILPSVWKAEQI